MWLRYFSKKFSRESSSRRLTDQSDHPDRNWSSHVTKFNAFRAHLKLETMVSFQNLAQILPSRHYRHRQEPPGRAPLKGWKSAGTHIGPKSWFQEERRTRNAGLMMGQPCGSTGAGLGFKKQTRYKPVGGRATCVEKFMPFNPTTVRQEGDRRRIIHGKVHCQAFRRVAVIVY